MNCVVSSTLDRNFPFIRLKLLLCFVLQWRRKTPRALAEIRWFSMFVLRNYLLWLLLLSGLWWLRKTYILFHFGSLSIYPHNITVWVKQVTAMLCLSQYAVFCLFTSQLLWPYHVLKSSSEEYTKYFFFTSIVW